MGLDVQQVVSDPCHYSAFECIICQSLVDLDCWVTVPCSHVFCRTCLTAWLERSDQDNDGNHNNNNNENRLYNNPADKWSCPTCHSSLSYASLSAAADPSQSQSSTTTTTTTTTTALPAYYSSLTTTLRSGGGQAVLVQPLATMQPVAYRVLRRIQVQCPLHETPAVQCQWRGDYGDLQAHLTSPSAHSLHNTSNNKTTTSGCSCPPATTTTTRTTAVPQVTTVSMEEEEEEEDNKNDDGDAVMLDGTGTKDDNATTQQQQPEESPTVLFPQSTASSDSTPSTALPVSPAAPAATAKSSVVQSTPPLSSSSNPQQPAPHQPATSNSTAATPTSNAAVSFLWERALALATSLKEQGNAQFGTQHYTDARHLYTKALEVLQQAAVEAFQQQPAASTPAVVAAASSSTASSTRFLVLEQAPPQARQLLAILYTNRAACWYGVGHWSDAQTDAEAALEYQPHHVKAHTRYVQAVIQESANFAHALERWNRVLNDQAGNMSVSAAARQQRDRVQQWHTQWREGQRALLDGQYARAKQQLTPLCKVTSAPQLLVALAEADLGMGRTEAALQWARQALRRGNANNVASQQQQQQQQSSSQDTIMPRAILVRGQATLLAGELTEGVTLLKHALRLDPDGSLFTKSQRQSTKAWLQVEKSIRQARDYHLRRQFDEAVASWTGLLQKAPLLPPAAPLYAVLYTERAQAHLRRHRYDAALEDCDRVLHHHRDDHLVAWCTRFSALHGKGQHQRVREETQRLLETWGQAHPQIQAAYDKAEFEVRKAARPDFYQLLQVPSLASEREIKKAYKIRAKDCHPDRLASMPAEQQQQATREFQQLGQALEILTHEASRKLYDQGYDVPAIQERLEAAERAAQYQQRHRSGSYYHH